MTDTQKTEVIEFATSDADAKARAESHYKQDPYPDVRPSLLSSFDISRYARKTGLLYPFYETKLKSASYEVRPGGQFIYWKKSGGKTERFEKTISRETQSIVLPPNSISYIQSEAYFRLPLYIAVRFNLRIKHVHRGILLGTGPIVDPGFSGQLLIPIHNLTSTEYELNLIPNDEDDGLIWVEFTKTTYDPSLDKGLSKFDKNKRDKSPNYYLHEANGGNPILSSIHDGIEEAKAQAEEAKIQAKGSASSADSSANLIRNYGIAGVAALIIGVGSLTLSGYNVTQGSLSVSRSAQQSVESLAIDSRRHESEMHSLQIQLASEIAKNKALAASLDAIERRVRAVEQNEAAKRH